MFNGKYNTASKRLGFLIGNNVHLTSLIAIGRLNVDLSELCDGLQRNRSIQEFHLMNVNLQGIPLT